MPNYGDPLYWEDRYKLSKGKTFEWLEDFKAVYEIILSVLTKLP